MTFSQAFVVLGKWATPTSQRTGRFIMSNDVSFIGNIPEHYDRGLGPIIFADYAADIARRAAACSPARVLEIAAGTGIVKRQLRDLLPAGADLTATDLNPPMLEVARRSFGRKNTWISGLQMPRPCRSLTAALTQWCASSA
jgi:SAM-dependent methyltransferase